jgi:uncharacterized repeat protein (TIGR01451 family)
MRTSFGAPRLYVLWLAILLPGGLFAQPLTISKFFGAPSILIGETTTLMIQVNNVYEEGPTQNNVTFTDTLPAGLVIATPNGLTHNCSNPPIGGTVTAVAGSQAISLAGATLPGAFGCVITVNVTGTSAGVKNNTTSPISSDTVTNGGTASASITVIVPNPATLTKTFGAASIPSGGTTSLSFTATNPNAAGQLTGLAFTDGMPPGLVVATPNGLATSGNCSGGTITAAAGSGSITLAGLTLTRSTSCTFSVNVTATSLGLKNNTTTAITSNEASPGAAASATINVVIASVPTLSPGALAGLAAFLMGLGLFLARSVPRRC